MYSYELKGLSVEKTETGKRIIIEWVALLKDWTYVKHLPITEALAWDLDGAKIKIEPGLFWLPEHIIKQIESL
jgi:hypothetical protein